MFHNQLDPCSSALIEFFFKDADCLRPSQLLLSANSPNVTEQEAAYLELSFDC